MIAQVVAIIIFVLASVGNYLKSRRKQQSLADVVEELGHRVSSLGITAQELESKMQELPHSVEAPQRWRAGVKRETEIDYISSEDNAYELSKYAGQWVILEGQEVLFGSTSLDELSKYVDDIGLADPFVYLVPRLDRRRIMVC